MVAKLFMAGQPRIIAKSRSVSQAITKTLPRIKFCAPSIRLSQEARYTHLPSLHSKITAMTDHARILLLQQGWLLPLLLLGLGLAVELGWRVGSIISRRKGQHKFVADETIIGAIFGLLALLLAFTFSGASDRYDHRRQLISDEINAISSAYQYIDLLSDSQQPKLRQAFKTLIEARLAVYKDVVDPNVYVPRQEQLSAASNNLWAESVKAVKETPYPEKMIASKYLDAVSAMGNALEDQRLALKLHPPRIIIMALLVLLITGSFVTGYNMGVEQRRDWLLKLLFIGLMAGAVYLTMSMEFPLVSSVGMADFEAELIKLGNQI